MRKREGKRRRFTIIYVEGDKIKVIREGKIRL